MSEPIDLKVSPLGVDNVSDARSEVFQPPMQPGDKPALLREANNVDVDRYGKLTRRNGRIKLADLTDGHSGTSNGGMMMLVDGGDLKRGHPNGELTTLVSGVGSTEISYCEAGGLVFWLNEQHTGCIVDGALAFWGLASPDAPGLAEVGGNLPPGKYMVALTVEARLRPGLDWYIESGCHAQAARITVGENAGIQITSTTNIDPRAASINIYCTEPNGRDLFWVDMVDIGAPLYINAVSKSLDLCDGLGAYPPPTGQIVREFSGRILVASGSTLYWSEPLAYHRFHLGSDLQTFPSRIVLLEPQIDGFYVACEDSATWFVAGTDPDEWRPIEVANLPTCEGEAIRVEGHKVPWAQTDAEVVAWATKDGWAAGLPGGIVKFPTSGRIAMDTHAKATMAFREQDGLRQLLLSMRDKRAASRFGATDRAVATVIKADGTIQ